MAVAKKAVVKKAVAKKELAAQEVDEATLALFAGVEDNEQLNQDELALPFLRIAQKGSPQVDEDSAEYIEGLKPGQFFNTATSEIYGDEISIQAHGYFQNFTIWKGEKGSGDFQGTMTPDAFRELQSTTNMDRDGGDFTRVVDGEPLRYTDTRNYIVVLPDHIEDGILMYPMSSTGIKASRTWNTLNNGRRINGSKAPRFATVWSLKTKGFEKSGYTWKQVSTVKPISWATPELAKLGIELKDMVDSIKATAGEAAHRANSSDGVQDEAADSDF